MVKDRRHKLLEQIDNYLRISDMTLTFTNTQTGTLYASSFVYRSPLCRSLNPVVNSGFIIVDPRYKGRGVATKIAEYVDVFSVQMGDYGHTSRIAVSARHAVPFIQSGRSPIGIIPRSLYVDGLGWMPDLIFYNGYTKNENIRKREGPPKIGNTGMAGVPESTMDGWKRNFERNEDVYKNKQTVQEDTKKENEAFSDDTRVKFENVEEFTNSHGDAIHISKATTLNDERIQSMFRRAAEKGEGFAMDEFNDHGIYECKLIQASKVLAAVKEPNMEIVGALVYGLPQLCRTPGQVVTAYIIVKDTERRKGNAQILHDYFMRMLKSQKQFNTVIIDVFKTDDYVLTWLLRHGYNVTGTIKYSGCITGSGHTDTLVLYKDLNPED